MSSEGEAGTAQELQARRGWSPTRSGALDRMLGRPFTEFIAQPFALAARVKG